MRRKIALTTLNCAAGLVTLGGIVDMLMPSVPANWVAYIGTPAVSPQLASLLLGLLRALGGCLLAIGLTSLLIINGPLKQGQRWAPWALLVLIGVSEGINASQMWRFGSPFYVPLAFVAITIAGLVAFPRQQPEMPVPKTHE